jgi:hypothetical protein
MKSKGISNGPMHFGPKPRPIGPFGSRTQTPKGCCPPPLTVWVGTAQRPDTFVFYFVKCVADCPMPAFLGASASAPKSKKSTISFKFCYILQN